MIKVPDFSDIQRFVITDFGAEEDDQQATSQAIVTAISAAVEAGGGRIVIPAGEWPTGKIHLKSNINIHLEEGATLLFSEDPKDYLPAVKTTWEGMECFNYSPLNVSCGCIPPCGKTLPAVAVLALGQVQRAGPSGPCSLKSAPASGQRTCA